MGIKERLLSAPAGIEAEHKPRVEFDGRTGFVQTGPMDRAPQPAEYEAILLDAGLDPKSVRIIGNPRISRWQRWDGQWLESYRFQVGPATVATPEDLIGIINGYKPHEPKNLGTGVFNFQASDLQIGKCDNGGSSGIIDAYLASVERAVKIYKARRKSESLGIAHLMYPGDCLEGNQSQAGKNMWRTDLTITEQMRVFRRLMLFTVEQFAPLCDELLLDVVNGNHDDAQREPVKTRPDDGHATEQAIALSDALELNKNAFGHVQVRVPDIDRSFMTVPVGDSVFTILHGHQFRRGKAMVWWQEQAFHGQNPAGAHFLIHGHYHTFEVETTANRTRIASSTFDGGSNYYRDMHGSESKRGGLTYITRAGEMSELTPV